MSKNSTQQTVEQIKEWRQWMIKRGSLKIKKKTKPLYKIQ